jgi:predicted nucleic acid-binding protein
VPVLRRVQAGELSVFVSAITEAELLVHPERDHDQAAIERIGDLFSEKGIFVAAVNRRVARRAARVRAQEQLKLPDAIIVATAIETGCEAIVGNDYMWHRLTEIPFVCLADVAAAV